MDSPHNNNKCYSISGYSQAKEEIMRIKCALHTHTTHSDGKLTPVEVVQLYYNSGYRVIAITDHDRDYDGPTEYNDMLIIPGNERSEGQCHVVEFGDIRILAHPKWSGLSDDAFNEKMKTCDAYEAFNATCRQRSSKWAYGKSTWPGKGIAVDDFHWSPWVLKDLGFTNFFDIGRTYIEMEQLSIAGVCDAIRTGCYTTSVR